MEETKSKRTLPKKQMAFVDVPPTVSKKAALSEEKSSKVKAHVEMPSETEGLYEVKLNEVKNVREVYGNWYSPKSYSAQYSKNNRGHTLIINVVGMVGGCGVAQCRGIYNITNPEAVIAFKEQILPNLKPIVDGRARVQGPGEQQRLYGAIFGYLGGAFWPTCEKYLLECGFVFVAEYPNYQHRVDGIEKQRMYMLKF